MTAIWPSSLPEYVLFDGYGEQPRMANAAFESDVGPPIERPRGTVALTDISMTMVMSDEQLETFEDFVFTDLAQATADFMVTHPRRRVQVRVRIKGRPPYQIAEYSPGFWRVSFQYTVIG